jgi:hypothetical protein
LEDAVDGLVRCALEHLGVRVMTPVRRGHRTLEVAVCVRILGSGHPHSEFASPEDMRACRDEALPEGSLILFLILRSPDCRGRALQALYREAVECVWPDDPQAGSGVDLDGGFRGWIGPLPAERLRRVAA